MYLYFVYDMLHTQIKFNVEGLMFSVYRYIYVFMLPLKAQFSFSFSQFHFIPVCCNYSLSFSHAHHHPQKYLVSNVVMFSGSQSIKDKFLISHLNTKTK